MPLRRTVVRPLATETSGPTRARRRAAFAVVLAGLVLAGIVVASEIASRTLRNFICDGRGGGFHVLNADYGWTHRPDARVTSHGCVGKRYEFRAVVETNSKGFCDKEYAYERLPGTPRVVALGDSVVEAAQVAREQGFTELLEQRWSAAGTAVDVINMGVAGFSTHNQLLLYRSEVRKYSPDLVVSEFNLQNDVGELSPAIHARVYSGSGGLPTADVRLDDDGEVSIDTSTFRAFAAEGERRMARVNRLDFWLTQNLYLYRRVRGLLAEEGAVGSAGQSASISSKPLMDMYRQPEPPEWQLAWKLTAAVYRQLAREVAGDGATLVVAIVPTKEFVSEANWRSFSQWTLGAPPAGSHWDRQAPHRRIEAILTELGIPFIDLTGAMRDAFAKTGKTGFFEFDPHPNADGHRVIADALEPYLSERLQGVRAAR